MRTVAYSVPWIPVELVKSMLKTKWKILDFGNNKISYDDINQENPEVILAFSPPEELLENKSVKYILTPGAGVDRLDLVKLSGMGMKVINSHANSSTVAEHAWSLLMATSRNITKYHSLIEHEGKWPNRGHIRDLNTDLLDKTIGIVGYGAIGMKMEQFANAFGMNPLIFRNHPDEKKENHYHSDKLIELANDLDVLMIACPLTEQSRGMISAEIIQALPSHAIIVNIARGEIIDEGAMISALRDGSLRGAGIDTWENSPYRSDEIGIKPEEFVGTPNLVISPHRAWVSSASFASVAEKLANELDLIYNNKESNNLVNIEKGY